MKHKTTEYFLILYLPYFQLIFQLWILKVFLTQWFSYMGESIVVYTIYNSPCLAYWMEILEKLIGTSRPSGSQYQIMTKIN